jgi:hypothetical protein
LENRRNGCIGGQFRRSRPSTPYAAVLLRKRLTLAIGLKGKSEKQNTGNVLPSPMKTQKGGAVSDPDSSIEKSLEKSL